jgi:hypothetical protein
MILEDGDTAAGKLVTASSLMYYTEFEAVCK